MSTQKGNILIPLLSGALLIALIIAGFFYWQNQQYQGEALGPYTPSNTPTPAPTIQDETANWKSYSDNRWGFSIGYPSSYKLVDTEWGIILTKETDQNASLTIGINGGMTITTKPQGEESITVGGIEAKKNIHLLPNSGEPILFHVVVNYLTKNYQFAFSNSSSNPISDSEQKEFDQILSTFKFTN